MGSAQVLQQLRLGERINIERHTCKQNRSSTGNKKQSMKNRSSDTISVGVGTSGGVETTAGDDDRVTMYTYIYRSSAMIE